MPPLSLQIHHNLAGTEEDKETKYTDLANTKTAHEDLKKKNIAVKQKTSNHKHFYVFSSFELRDSGERIKLGLRLSHI